MILLAFVVIQTLIWSLPVTPEFISKVDVTRLAYVLPILYQENNVACFLEICNPRKGSCPVPKGGICPPNGIKDTKLRAGQLRSLEDTKSLVREKLWLEWWHNIIIPILFVINAVLLFYLGRLVEHLDPKLMKLQELTDLALPYDGSFGFPLRVQNKMKTKLDFYDDFVHLWRKQSLEKAPVTDLTGWHDHSDTPPDIAEERRVDFKRRKKLKIEKDEEHGIRWAVKKPSALDHPNFEADNERLKEYLRVRARFKLEKKQMKRALLEHDVALARRIQAGMRLVAKHNALALTKRLEELQKKVARLRAKKARAAHRRHMER